MNQKATGKGKKGVSTQSSGATLKQQFMSLDKDEQELLIKKMEEVDQKGKKNNKKTSKKQTKQEEEEENEEDLQYFAKLNQKKQQ